MREGRGCESVLSPRCECADLTTGGGNSERREESASGEEKTHTNATNKLLHRLVLKLLGVVVLGPRPKPHLRRNESASHEVFGTHVDLLSPRLNDRDGNAEVAKHLGSEKRSFRAALYLLLIPRRVDAAKEQREEILLAGVDRGAHRGVPVMRGGGVGQASGGWWRRRWRWRN